MDISDRNESMGHNFAAWGHTTMLRQPVFGSTSSEHDSSQR